MTWTLDSMHKLRDRIWETRDACTTHYPERCPTTCDNAGKHDQQLAAINACDCTQCHDR